MALTKRINYYKDDDGYYRRIPWDTILLDGTVEGISPVGIVVDNVVSFDSSGDVTVSLDFVDVGVDEEIDSEIVGFTLWDDERVFVNNYEHVTGFYESESSQTYEFDFDKPSYAEA